MKKPKFVTGEEAAAMIKDDSTIDNNRHDPGFCI